MSEGRADFEFLMSLAIDQGSALNEILDIYDSVKQKFGEGAKLEVQTELSLEDAKAELKRLAQELQKLQKPIEEAEKEVGEFERKVTNAAQKLEKVLPGSAKEFKEAFAKSADDAVAKLDEIEKKIKSLTPADAIKNLVQPRNASTAMTAARDYTESVDSYRAARRERRGLDPASPRYRLLGEKLETYRIARAHSSADLADVIEGGSSNVKSFLRNYRSLKSPGSTPTLDTSDISQHLEGYRKAQGKVQELGQEAQSAISYIKSFTEMMRSATQVAQATPTSPSTSAKVDTDGLLKSISSALESNVFTAKVIVDAQHLLASLEETLSNAPSLRSAIGLPTRQEMASMVAAAREAASAVRTANRAGIASLSPEQRHAQLAEQAERRKFRRNLVSETAPLLGHVDPGLAKLHEEVLAAAGSTDIDKIRKALGETRSKLLDAFDTKASDKNLRVDLRERMSALGRGYDSAFIKPLKEQLATVQSSTKRAQTDRDRLAKAHGDALAMDIAWERDRQRRLERHEREIEKAQRSEKLQQRSQEVRRRAQLNRQIIDARADVSRAFTTGNPLTFVGRHAPNLVPILEAMAQVQSPLAPEQLQAAMTGASSAKNAFGPAIDQLVKGAQSPVDRAIMEAIRDKTTSRYVRPVTDLETRQAGRNATANAALLRWQDMSAGLEDTMAAHLGSRSEVTADVRRDRWREQLTSFHRYKSQVEQFEKAQLALKTSVTDEDRKAAAIRLEGMRRELDIAEQMVKYRTLVGTGKIDLAGYGTHDKGDAIGVIARGLDQELGQAFKAFRSERPENRNVSFGAYQSALFDPKSDVKSKAIAESFLKTRIQNATVVKKIMADEHSIHGALKAQLTGVQRLYTAQKELNAEVGETVAKMDRLGRNQNPGGAGFSQTIRNGFAMFGGFGLGYAAAFQIRRQMQAFMQYQQEIAGIQGVLNSRHHADASFVSEGVAKTASKYGMDLLETAKSAKLLAQSGMDAQRVLKELDYTLMASKGMGVTIEQMYELQLAIKAITDENDKFTRSVSWTQAVLEKVSQVEAAYAVESRDLADAITALSPILEQYTDGMSGVTDVFDETIGMTTVLVERLRITGTQAANALKMLFTRLARPGILNQLQENFGARLGTPDGKDLLPLDALIPEIGRTYDRLAEENPLKAKQFAEKLIGGRQIAPILTLLQEYNRAQDISMESSYAWASSQERAALAAETLQTATDRVNIGLQNFVRSGLDSTHVGAGLVAILNRLADGMNGLSTMGGARGTGGMLATILGVGAAFSGVRRLFQFLQTARKYGGLAGTVASRGGQLNLFGNLTSRAGILTTVGTRLTGVLGTLARIFTPGGLLIAGATALVGIFGALSSAAQSADKNADRYRTTIKSLSELRVWEAPQATKFTELVTSPEVGYGTAEAAYQDVVRTLGISGSQYLRDADGNRVPVREDAAPEMPEGLQKALTMSTEEFNKWRRENTESVRAVVKEYTKAFIESLPEAARKGFEEISTEQERVARVAEMVGGAAFAANLQIADSITQIHASANRMVADSIGGIRDLAAEVESLSVMQMAQTAWRSIRGAFGADVEKIQREDKAFTFNPTEIDAGVTKALKLLENIPLFEPLIATKQAREAMHEILSAQPLPPKPQMIIDPNTGLYHTPSPSTDIKQVQLLQEFVDKISANPKIQDFLAGHMGRAIAPADVVASLQTGVGQGVPVDEKRVLEDSVSKLGDNVTERLMKSVREYYTKVSPEAANLDRAVKMIQSSLGGTGTKANLEGATFALARFKSSLIDLTQAVFEAVHKFETDRRFAEDYGQTYDAGNALINLGRGLLQTQDSAERKTQWEIVKLLKDLHEAEARHVPTDGDSAASRRARLSQEVADLRKIGEQFLKADFTELLKTGQGSDAEAIALTNTFKSELSSILQDADIDPAHFVTKIRDFFNTLPSMFIDRGMELQRRRDVSMTQLQLEKEVLDKRAELNRTSLPINATLAQQAMQRAQAEQATYELELRSLQTKLEFQTISQTQYEIDRAALELRYQYGKEMSAQITDMTALRELESKLQSDFQQMLSGIQSTATDTSIWKGIVDPEGDSVEARARARAEAIREVIYNTISPLFSTIYTKMTEAMFEGLTTKMAQSGVFKKLFGEALESRAMADASSARSMAHAISESSRSGALMMGQAIVNASQIAAAKLSPTATPATTGKFASFIHPGWGTGKQTQGAATLAPVVTTASGAEKPITTEDKDSKDSSAYWATIGMMVGNMGGTALGRGGRGAQLGSGIGSVGGMIAGQMLIPIPGFGTAIGGAVGGLLGGLLGGSTDKHDASKLTPTIRALTAIERAQRDTITTIQSSTESLLRLDNRLLNLPTSFTIPQYRPNIGGGSTTTAVNNTYEITINIPVTSNASIRDIERVAKTAVSEALYEGSQRRSWG